MNEYIIMNQENGMALAAIGIKRNRGLGCVEQSIEWTVAPDDAIQLELEEAQGVIQFIDDVIDWELALQLTAEPLRI